MPNGQFPVITAGQDPTASLLQSFAPWKAWKSGDTPRASTITPAADPDLTAPLAANAVYDVEVLLFYTGGTTGSSDLEVTPAVPGSATAVWTAEGLDASLNPLNWTAHTGFIFGTNGTGSVRSARISGTVITSVTAGNCVITWSQNTSNGTATTLKAGCRMTVSRSA